MSSKPKLKVKVKTQKPPEFESPLNQFIRENCNRCSDYPDECKTYTAQGIDRMFLCMTAASLHGAPTTDPDQILQDAENALKGMFPAMFSQNEEDTPDEQVAPKNFGLRLKK